MSTDTPPPNTSPSTGPEAGPPQAHPMRRFLNFWFAPADPSILGFMRVIAGLLVIYTHVAYTPDLTNFFGQDAWYDLAAIDRERHELPQVAPSLGWDDPLRPLTGAQIPEYPHRRRLLIAHIRALVGDGPPPADVGPKLAYLERFVAADEQGLRAYVTPGGITQEGVMYLMALAENPTDRANQLAVFADESLRAEKSKSRIPDLPISASPSLVSGLSKDDRAKLATDAEAFFRLLPANIEERTVVLRHYFEMGHNQRVAFLAYIKRLAGVSAEEREKLIGYLEYWNVDPGIVTRFGSPIFSIWFHITDPASMYVAHGVILVIFVLFTLGVCTRVTSVLAWLAAVSYLHRSMQILFGMDTMMNLLLFLPHDRR